MRARTNRDVTQSTAFLSKNSRANAIAPQTEVQVCMYSTSIRIVLPQEKSISEVGALKQTALT